MQPDWLHPFAHAASATLKELACLSPRRCGGGELPLPAAGRLVSVVVGLSGDASGSVALILPERTALDVAGRVVDARLGGLDGVATITLRELGRMIAGRAKRQLARAGRRVVMSPPRVVVRRRRRPRPGPKPCLRVRFESEAGPFALEARLAAEPSSHPA